jgi:hypothetical protein
MAAILIAQELALANKCREIQHLIEDNHWLIRLPPETTVNGKPVKESWRVNRNIEHGECL